MKPRFKLNQYVVYCDRLPEFEIFPIRKRSYDIDEEQFEYWSDFDDISYYEYHLNTLTEALKIAKQFKYSYEQQIMEIQNDLDKINTLITQLNNIKHEKINNT